MESPRPTAKQSMADIIARDPDDSTYDEILREPAYARMVQRGLADSNIGRSVSNSEIRERIESWRK